MSVSVEPLAGGKVLEVQVTGKLKQEDYKHFTPTVNEKFNEHGKVRALAKLDHVSKQVPMDVDPAHATAYIVNPLTGRQASFAKLFMTHPPMEDRIARLVGTPAHAQVAR